MLRLDINIVFTIINLLILYVIFRVFLFKPINKIIEKRRLLVEQQFAEADDAKAQAEALTERTNSDVAAAKAEYDKLHASAEEYRASFRKLIEAQLQTLKANDLLFK